MSLEAFGDGDVFPDPCEQCMGLEDLIEAVRKISKTTVYEDGEMAKGVSVELIAAISEARRIAEECAGLM